MLEQNSVVEKQRLRLDFAYDGTAFSGWAKQPGLRTVQGELEEALAILTRNPVDALTLTVGGRTDAGVHARSQVCHFDVTPRQLVQILGRYRADTLGTHDSSRRLNGVLNRKRAKDIVVERISAAPPGFDARFSAVSRRYEYRARPVGVHIDPLTRTFTTDLRHSLDLEIMQRASYSLLGLRDFTTFCRAREGSTAVRTLQEFDWHVTAEGVFIARVVADAFCHSMVRALVGAVVAVGGQKISFEELEHLIEARERTSRFVVLPAKGLSLQEIKYPADDELFERARQTRAKRVLPDLSE